MIASALALSGPTAAPASSKGGNIRLAPEGSVGNPPGKAAEKETASFGDSLQEAEKAANSAEPDAEREKEHQQVKLIATKEASSPQGRKTLQGETSPAADTAPELVHTPVRSTKLITDKSNTGTATSSELETLKPLNSQSTDMLPVYEEVLEETADTQTSIATSAEGDHTSSPATPVGVSNIHVSHAPVSSPASTSIEPQAPINAPEATPSSSVPTQDLVVKQADAHPPSIVEAATRAEDLESDARPPLSAGDTSSPATSIPATALSPPNTASPSATSAQALQAALPLNMTMPLWPQSLADYVAQQWTGESHSLTLTLTPERMGSLQIKISLEEGRTDIHIIAESAEAVAALRDAQQKLVDAFGRAGLELGSQSLRLDDAGAQHNGTQGRATDEQTDFEDAAQNASSESDEAPTAASSLARTGLLPRQSIDLLA